MQPLSKLATPSQTRKKSFNPDKTPSKNEFNTFGLGEVMGHYRGNKNNQYENGYSSITKIANRFANAFPQSVDANGNSANNSNVMSRLYFPNDKMSRYDFCEALCVMFLLFPETHIIVHSNTTPDDDGHIREEDITGFTFFQGSVTRGIDGKKTYKYRDGSEEDARRVFPIGGLNPYNVTRGYAAAQAAYKWTNLDDLIAEYQTGFFANGAVPSGQFIIRTRTATEFNKIVDAMQEKHRGAGSNNNVSYTHEALDDQGKPQGASIEWIPFNQVNKDLSMAALFEQSANKIDSVYGVPASIRAVNDNNTYASVRVDQQIFVEETVQPITTKIWGKFTHGLNRITGGLGFSIYAEIEVPNVADEEKVVADKKKVEADLINTMLAQGFTLEGIVNSFGLDEEYLKLGEASPTNQDEEDEVAEPQDVNSTPGQVDPQYPMAKGKKKRLSRTDEVKYVGRMADIIRQQLNAQVGRAIENLDSQIDSKAYGDSTDAEDTSFATKMILALTPIVTFYGKKQNEAGVRLVLEAGLRTDDIKPYKLTDAQRNKYTQELKKVGRSFNDQTGEQIRSVLSRGIADELTRGQIEENLRGLIDDEYRVNRLAITEVNRTEGMASVTSMENIAEETGYKIAKVWKHSGDDDPCEFCATMIGTELGTAEINQPFIPEGGTIKGVDGGELVNNYGDMDTADAHPFCHCYTDYEVQG